ncbi:MAG: 50S ribosomal protein L35 [Planctomycetes bacterium]|jgi:ribosomal protein L35|nr:50S ribosomal protein L35 [Planctomycetota bacterium]
MPKMKTHQATVKRFKLTKNNKIQKRRTGQDHFNARQDGNSRRKKRRDMSGDNTLAKTIKTLMPYK